jgi:hypothetical protein
MAHGGIIDRGSSSIKIEHGTGRIERADFLGTAEVL